MISVQKAWVGTRLLLAREANFHPAYRQQVMAARETDTVLSSVFDEGWPDAPHRCLINDTLAAWLAAGKPEPGQRPNEGEIVEYHESGEAISRYSMMEPTEGMTGQVTSIAMYAGQGVGLTNTVKPVAEILEQMVADASAILSSFTPG